MKRTWIHHAIIVNEGRRFPGSVVIEGEKIQEVIEATVLPLPYVTNRLMRKDASCCRE